ncbi:MAG: hypothetical protein RR060_04870 [Victivallaceae bacterium]
MKKLCLGGLAAGMILVLGGCKGSFFDYNKTPGGSAMREKPAVENTAAAVESAPLKKNKIDPVEEANIPKHVPANKGKLLGYDYDNAGVASSLNETERQYYDEFRADSERKKNKSVFSLF